MNYAQVMTDLIAHLSQDKGIPQPQRNAVASSARRLDLEIRGALTMTNSTPPAGTVPGWVGEVGNACICYPGLRNKSCTAAVHVT